MRSPRMAVIVEVTLAFAVCCAGEGAVDGTPPDSTLQGTTPPTQQNAFVEHIIAPSVAGAISVTSADMDSDGDMDVLGAAFSGDRITWWENLGG